MGNKSNKIFYIIGAGSAGISLFHDIRAKSPNAMVFFLDDDEEKAGTTIDNCPVMGPIDTALSALKPNNMSEVIIALPSSPTENIKRIYNLLTKNNFNNIKILPTPLASLETPHLIQAQKIDINDLLSRDTIYFPDKETLSNLKGKRVLISGAGGTIGTELAVQLLYAGVSRMYLLGHGEHSIYQINKKLHTLQQRGVGVHTHCIPILCELTDPMMVKHTLSKLKADVIFHAAAFKHVDLVEENAAFSIAVNIFGAKHLLEFAKESGTGHFILISTDKAVNPSSIYGATKLVSEELARAFASSSMKTSIMRFGNVLGSRGSVVPLFQEQISMGGPITITSAECKRYFMTISEACSLILYALHIKNENQCKHYVLEMGEQIYVQDLAKQMIEFYGLEPERDIKLSYIGMRAGEKIEETLIAKGEIKHPTPIKHVFLLENTDSEICIEDLSGLLEKLYPACFFVPEAAEYYRNSDYIKKILTSHISTLVLTSVDAPTDK